MTLPETVGDELAAHLARFGPGDDGLIFTSNTGAPLRRSTWQTAFARAARDTSVEASGHDLRHHCASLLISAGCSVTAVQHFLGHKNASETFDTDSYLWPTDEGRIREPSTPECEQMCTKCARAVHPASDTGVFSLVSGLCDGESVCKRDSVIVSDR